MQPAKAISNVLKNLDILLFNTVEIEADYVPSFGEIVLFLDEKNEWHTGAFVANWNDLRKKDWSDERLETDTSVEDSPYYGDTVIRSKVNYAEKNEDGEWVVDFTFSYPATADILEFEPSNISYAFLSNQAHQIAIAKDAEKLVS